MKPRITKIKNLIIQYKSLLGLFGASFFMRAITAFHGFPYIYHPDEPTVVNRALMLRFNINPHYFDWPHLQNYISFILFQIYIKARVPLNMLGLHDITQKHAPIIWDDPVVFYLIARLFTALMGASTVVLVYLIAKKLFDRRVALLSALIVMLNPISVSESQVATVDVPMTFWLVVSFYFVVNIYKRGLLKDYLLAGLFLGFATSTKYNGGIGVVLILSAGVLYMLNHRDQYLSQVKGIIGAGLASLLGFLIGTPFALFDYKTFLIKNTPQGALWQFAHVGSQGEPYFNTLWQRLFVELPASYGGLLTIFTILIIFWLLIRKKAKEYLILILPVVYLLYVSTFSYFQPHFLVPIIPFLAIIFAYGFFKHIDQLEVTKKAWGAKMAVILLVVVLFSPSMKALKDTVILTRIDTRSQAALWFEQNTEDGSTVARGRDYEPVLREKEGEDDLDRGYYVVFLDDILPLETKLTESSKELLVRRGVDYVLLGGYDLDDKFRRAEWNEAMPSRMAFLKEFLTLTMRFDPLENPGPTVLIFSTK